MTLVGRESAHQVRGPTIRARSFERGSTHVLLHAIARDGREGLRLLTGSALEVLEARCRLGA